MNKKQNEERMQQAELALHDNRVQILNGTTIKDSYNGQTAALGVTIAMSGLRPALAIYVKGTDRCSCNRLQILNAIAIMLNRTESMEPGRELYNNVINCSDAELKHFKQEILDCSIALKQVIRTYNLKKDED